MFNMETKLSDKKSNLGVKEIKINAALLLLPEEELTRQSLGAGECLLG